MIRASRRLAEKAQQDAPDDDESEESVVDITPPPPKRRKSGGSTSSSKKGSRKSDTKIWTEEEVQAEIDEMGQALVVVRICLHSTQGKPAMSQRLLTGARDKMELWWQGADGVGVKSEYSHVKAKIGACIAENSEYELVQHNKFQKVCLFARKYPQNAPNNTGPESLVELARGDAFEISSTATWKRALVTRAYREKANTGSEEAFEESSQDEPLTEDEEESLIQPCDVDALYLDVIATAQKKPDNGTPPVDATTSSSSQTRRQRSVQDNQTALKIIVLGPAYKDDKDGGKYKVESTRIPSNANTTFTIPAPGPDKERASVGHIMRLVKNKAVSLDTYKSPDGNLVGVKSNIFVQENRNGKEVSPVEPDDPNNAAKINTNKFWELVNVHNYNRVRFGQCIVS